MKKKIAIIGTVGLPANYGGFETLTNHLVSNLNNKYDFTIYCSGRRCGKTERIPSYKGACLKYLPFNANGVQSIIYDSISILHALFYADVLLILGVAGAWTLPFVRLFTNKRIIISIDGIEWKRDKWNRLAKMYLWVAERIAVKYSHIDISDNESIQDYTALRYGSLSRIVEYGGDHIEYVEPTDKDFENYSFLTSQYAVKVCRIEPENNVHVVLEAFTKIKNKRLVIVGNWNHSDYGRNLKQTYASCKNIFMLNPIYDQRTLDVIRGGAVLYIHGHSAGGTNPSLVEAMNLELPVLAFNVSYNRTTTENKAAYFKGVEDIEEYVASKSMHDLKANAIVMKNIANRRYKWAIIAQKYDALILEALAVGEKEQLAPQLVMALNNDALHGYQVGHLQHQYLFFESK
jgi:glycosyltransferase involved in cell wall biosynthesis